MRLDPSPFELYPSTAAILEEPLNSDDSLDLKTYFQERHFRQWAWVLCLCGLVAVICSLDRTAMSVAIIPMSDVYGWKDAVKGAVAGSFNIGYTVTNLCGGYLAATLSPKYVLGWGVLVWSVFTVATPLAASSGYLLILYIVRALMGLGEGVAFPAMQYVVKSSIPVNVRSRALGLIYSGHQIGSILALLLTPPIIGGLGWPSVFYFFGVIGLVWIFVWEYGTQETAPAPLPAGNPMTGLLRLPVAKFCRSRPVWALAVAHAMFGVSYNLCMSWLPTYYHQEYGLDIRASAGLSVLPFAVMALTTNLSGWIADYLINKRVTSTTRARKILQLVGTLGPALSLSLLVGGRGKPHVSVGSAVAALTATMGLLGLQAGGFASTHTDMSTKYAGVLFGATNALSSLAGSASVVATGLVLERTASWAAVFRAASLCNVASGVVFTAWATSEAIFD